VQSFLEFELVARERFELSSAAPEAAMFDHCTTGLLNWKLKPQTWDKYFSARQKHGDVLLFLFFQRLLDAVAFLSAWIPVFAAPQRRDYSVLTLQKSSCAKHLVGEIVGVVAGAVSAVLVFARFLLHGLNHSSGSGFSYFTFLARLKSFPSLSLTEATINGKTIIASPITMVLSA
jgi:hypothetical protein